MTLPTNLHPLSAITLHPYRGADYLLAFRDTQQAVKWFRDICNQHHEHQETRDILSSLCMELYMMPARHTPKGNLKVLTES